MDDEPRYWYAARPYRWGGYRRPLTWEGWAVDLILFAALFGIGPYVREPRHPWQSLGLVFGLLALSVAITHWKGEPDSWAD
jgi:hypothetical protein